MRTSLRLTLALVLGASVLLGVRLVPGTHAAGNPIPADSGITSNGLVQPNKPSSGTTTTLLNATASGQGFVLTATVSCALIAGPGPGDTIVPQGRSFVPLGNVDFFANGVQFATAELGSTPSSTAFVSISVSSTLAGQTIVAIYEGTESCSSSSSAPLVLGVPYPALPFGVVAMGIAVKGCGSTNPPATTLMYFGQATQVRAIPCNGGTFTGWTGGPCNGTTLNPCDIAPDGSTVITANFSS